MNLNTEIYSIGALVHVDPEERHGRPNSEGGLAFVNSFDEESLNLDVSYTVTGQDSQEVLPSRVKAASFATTARCRSPDEATRPSLLAPSHSPSNAGPENNANVSIPPNRSRKGIAKRLLESASWHPSSNKKHPLLLSLSKGRKKEKGWIRAEEAKIAGRPEPKPGSQLSTPERQLVVHVEAMRNSLTPSKYPKGSHPLADHAHAWGVTTRTVKRTYSRVLERNKEASQKKRTDAGKTLFNSEDRRIQVYTPLEYFKRNHRINNAGEYFTDEELRDMYNGLSEAERVHCQQGAQSLIARSPFLGQEVGNFLRNTQGRITWRRLASSIAGGNDNVKLVCHVTLMNYVMGLPDSAYSSPRLLPMLTAQTKRIRLHWAQAWFIFWHGACLLAPSVQVLKVDNDEKWFFAIVVRTHQKLVPFYGVTRAFQSVHHKSHIGKELGICTTGFLPFDNDFLRGGRGVKIHMQRAGGMVKAKKDSFKRVYKPDGGYHYPRLPENKLRSKGEEYFESWEITGSDEGTESSPKYSLMKYWEEELFPVLDAKAQELEAELNKRIVVRFQWDNAPPHVDGTLVEYLKSEFANRGWLLIPQPPNSPLANTQDVYLFPALAKKVTEDQGINNHGRYLQGKALWETVMRCWEAYPEATIARSYMHQSQVVGAILGCNGSDDFVKESRSLHCGIRKIVHPYYETENAETPSGVELLESLDPLDLGNELRYPNSPNIFDFEAGKSCTVADLQWLVENLDSDYDNYGWFAAAAYEAAERDEIFN